MSLLRKIEIKPSRYKKFRKVYIDNEYIGSLPESFIPGEYYLSTESVVSPEWLSQMTSWVEKNALNKLLEYLSKAEKTVYDCKIYLKKLELPAQTIDIVIEEACAKNWLSDERYAFLYTEDAILSGKSQMEIKHKLKQKRVSTSIINEALKTIYTEDTKKSLLSDSINTLIKRYNDIPKNKLFEKIATALYRKGFVFNDYEEILKKVLTKIDE